MLLFGITLLEHAPQIHYWNHPLNMCMHVCYIDHHEAGLCCYLVIYIENLLHPLQLLLKLLWPTYWQYSFRVLASMCETTQCHNSDDHSLNSRVFENLELYHSFNFIKFGPILQIKHIVINFKHIMNVSHKIQISSDTNGNRTIAAQLIAPCYTKSSQTD
jgi:hypothetical protein